MSLKEYLANKPLYYEHIDYERLPRIFKNISHFFKLPRTVHIVGTNGKGSTGRFLAQILESEGFSVGHYTSPHILKFNERIYKNCALIGDDELENLHIRLLGILGEYEKELSYFEYATLLAFLAFESCDFALLEAGVGGEFDATNIVPKELSVVTPISLDHQDLLGNTIKEIAFTKLSSVKNKAVIASQEFDEVIGIAQAREAICGFDFLYVDKDEKNRQIEKYASKFSLPHFLKQNLLAAFKSAEFLGIKPDLSRLGALSLRARCEKIRENVTLDAGHNTSAAKILFTLFKDKKIILVYNSYLDKDYKSILEIFRPILKRVEIIEIDNPLRKNAKDEIKKTLESWGIGCCDFQKIDKNEEYLVFGSFGVAETFLKGFNER